MTPHDAIDATATEICFDPSGLTSAQRAGRACVVCGKRWPAPPVRVGRVAGGGAVYACTDDAPVIERARAYT
ncbi:hypothetical protein BTM25_25350 [Actinomadura rubteroloni]|uniref:Uncharacterized protein n=1 Tax=Actinomadura rubteroloni TaxID=1926885 RepID=A0A2P4UFV0_9ACTN|nr:hypothetical protein [Actinomadura rubteroloni]POM23909.1 hypothetical protein BTM25_25350 [Actinomadura rubteroloni]